MRIENLMADLMSRNVCARVQDRDANLIMKRNRLLR